MDGAVLPIVLQYGSKDLEDAGLSFGSPQLTEGEYEVRLEILQVLRQGSHLMMRSLIIIFRT